MKDSIRQNLIDAGCSEEFIEKFDSCICDESKCEKLLAEHRKELLKIIHCGLPGGCDNLTLLCNILVLCSESAYS